MNVLSEGPRHPQHSPGAAHGCSRRHGDECWEVLGSAPRADGGTGNWGTAAAGLIEEGFGLAPARTLRLPCLLNARALFGPTRDGPLPRCSRRRRVMLKGADRRVRFREETRDRRSVCENQTPRLELRRNPDFLVLPSPHSIDATGISLREWAFFD